MALCESQEGLPDREVSRHLRPSHIPGAMEWDYSHACEACQQLCDLYMALADEAVACGRDKCWQLKPKIHLMIEMIQYLSLELGVHSENWFYRDESFVGFWAKASHRRGGANNPATTVERFLQRWRAMDEL